MIIIHIDKVNSNCIHNNTSNNDNTNNTNTTTNNYIDTYNINNDNDAAEAGVPAVQSRLGDAASGAPVGDRGDFDMIYDILYSIYIYIYIYIYLYTHTYMYGCVVYIHV